MCRPAELYDRFKYGDDRYLLKGGGLNRVTLSSDAWHARHPEAATHLFGFASWEETKDYLWVLWPELEPLVFSIGEAIHNKPISPFEQCLLTKMRIRRGLVLSLSPPLFLALFALTLCQ